MSKLRVVVLMGATVCCAYGAAALGLAQQARAQAPTGAYPGVTPGTRNSPAVMAKPGDSPMCITWPGFQLLAGGGARVFVQATGPLPTELSRRGNQWFVPLGKARLAHRNNGRPLDTRFFKTAVSKVFVTVTKALDATLVIEVTRDVRPVLSSHRDANGFQLLHVDFPGAGGVVPAAPNPPAPSSPAPPPAPAQPTAGARGGAAASGAAKAGASRGSVRAGGTAKVGF